MKRLTEKRRFKDFRPDEEITTICVDGYFEVVDNYNNFSCGKESHYYLVGEAIDKLAEYEDAEEQGLLLRIPCKVGDIVYVFHTILECEYEYKVTRIRETQFEIPMIAMLGKSVFLTKAEAEKALEEMG